MSYPEPPGWQPRYLHLFRTGELARRAEAALAGLACCTGCPRRCRVDRRQGAPGLCRTGRHARVAAWGPAFDDPACLVGTRGSGALVFGSCSLRCVFCDTAGFSRPGCGLETPADGLADIMLGLQAAGCHNLRLVTPEHVTAQVLEALVIAAGRGLRLPLVYDTSAYDAPASLRLLDGVVDVYLPDFKVWEPAMALRYLRASNYAQAARQAIGEMHRQVGPLLLDQDGLARQGVLVRHLVLPGGLAGTAPVMRWLARAVSPATAVDIMDGYHPAALVSAGRFPEIDRRATPAECAEARAQALRAGLRLMPRTS